MRTTVELPPELLRRSKSRAAARGESLKALLTRALTAELDRDAAPRAPRERVSLPLFGESTGRGVNVTSAAIARVLADRKAARVTASRRRR